jgi:hypothetical protein
MVKVHFLKTGMRSGLKNEGADGKTDEATELLLLKGDVIYVESNSTEKKKAN